MNKKCHICGSSNIRYTFSYRNSVQKEGRRWYRCENCSAFNADNINIRKLYETQYYPSIGYIKKRFAYVNSLPDRKSNNYYRVLRLSKYIRMYERLELLKGNKRKILDVGCGFGIFLHKFFKKEKAWDGIGVDLDLKLKRFLKSIGIKMIVSRDLSQLRNKFDLITFNRVLEHVKNPLALLKKARRILKERGIIYIEVPDMLGFSLEGKKSEMFADDHYSVFSPKGVFLLAEKAGLNLLSLSRISEVNNKITLYAFFSRKEDKR